MGQYYKIQITRKTTKPKEEEWVAIHEILFGAREDEKEPRYASEILRKEKGEFKTIVSESYGKRGEWDHLNSAEFVALEQLLYDKRAVVSIVWDYSKWASITRWDCFEEKNFYEIGDKLKDCGVKRPRYLINYTYNIYVDMEEYEIEAGREAKNTWDWDRFWEVYHPIALLCNVWKRESYEYYMGMNIINIGNRCDTVIWMSDTLPAGCQNDTQNSIFVQNFKRKYEIIRTKFSYFTAINTEWEIIKRFDSYDEINKREKEYFNWEDGK